MRRNVSHLDNPSSASRLRFQLISSSRFSSGEYSKLGKNEWRRHKTNIGNTGLHHLLLDFWVEGLLSPTDLCSPCSIITHPGALFLHYYSPSSVNFLYFFSQISPATTIIRHTIGLFPHFPSLPALCIYHFRLQNYFPVKLFLFSSFLSHLARLASHNTFKVSLFFRRRVDVVIICHHTKLEPLETRCTMEQPSAAGLHTLPHSHLLGRGDCESRGQISSTPRTAPAAVVTAIGAITSSASLVAHIMARCVTTH